MSKTLGTFGSTAKQVSVAGAEIFPEKPKDWSQPYRFVKFSFKNDIDCSISLNGREPLHIDAGDGFELGHEDENLTSFRIMQDGVNFKWIGGWG